MPSEIKKFIETFEKLIGADSIKTHQRRREGLPGCADQDAQKMAAARKRLVDSGVPEARLSALPADQVILLDEEREMRARFDEIAKSMPSPPWQVRSIARKIQSGQARAGAPGRTLLPSQAPAPELRRLEQRIALLRHVEALRMYAAEHNGTFPAKLADISVPLPEDPITGRPVSLRSERQDGAPAGTPPEVQARRPVLPRAL